MESRLRRNFAGIHIFAYTVADIVLAWPTVHWPVPGELRPLSHWNNDTRLWLEEKQQSIIASGRSPVRHLPRINRNVSNLLSYFIHEPSLALWLRRFPWAQTVWAIEQDCTFLGDLRIPSVHFANRSFDLATVFSPSTYIEREWPVLLEALPAMPASLFSGSGAAHMDSVRVLLPASYT